MQAKIDYTEKARHDYEEDMKHKCQICGQMADKLYSCRFTDDPEDTWGYDAMVCSSCVPENQEDVFEDGG